MRNLRRLVILGSVVGLLGCGGGDPAHPPADAARDGAVDGPADAAIDAAIDAAVDAAIDAAIDAAVDAATDAAIDAAIDAPTDASLLDGPPIDGPATTCDPIAPPGAQGCGAGEKCTWILIDDTIPLGTLGCVPDGTAALGAACVRGAPGPTTGYDDCDAGLICVGGTCADVCGFGAGPGDACAPGYACTRYNGVFASGTDPAIAGACSPSCDPLTQLRADGSDCGSGRGCYLLVSSTTTIAVCAAAGWIGHGQPITTTPFANSCLPGHQPRRPFPGATTYECGALCRPADVYQGHGEADEGGVAPYTCASHGAAPPSNPTAGESCRYWWPREPFTTLSPFSNTVGWCLKHAVWTYDSNGDFVDDAPFPRCPTLTTGDVVPPIANPPHNDAQYFWCVATLPSFAKGLVPLRRLAVPAMQVDRLR